jgi:hypothetical protein
MSLLVEVSIRRRYARGGVARLPAQAATVTFAVAYAEAITSAAMVIVVILFISHLRVG